MPGSVALPAVGLDYYSLGGPGEVHPVAEDGVLHPGAGYAMAVADRQEAVLQMRAGRNEVIKENGERPARAPCQHLPRGIEVEQTEELGLADRPLKLVRLNLMGKVHQRSRRRRDRDPGMNGGIGGVDFGAMDGDPLMAAPSSAGDRDVGPAALPLTDPVVRGGAAVAQQGAWAAREHRGKPPGLPPRGGMADRVHPLVQPVEPPRGRAPADRPFLDADLDELRPRDDAVLCGGQFGDCLVEKRTHTVHISPSVRARPRGNNRSPS